MRRKIILLFCLLIIFVSESFSLYGIEKQDVVIDSIERLILYAQKDNVHVKMKAGKYVINDITIAKEIIIKSTANGTPKEIPVHSLICFSGSNSIYDLEGVIIEIDTKLHAEIKTNQLFEVFVNGNNNHISGLVVKDIGNQVPYRGAIMMHVIGDNNVISNVSLHINGSSPYGYGHHLGKGGSGSYIKLQKHSSLLVSGANTSLLGCKVFTQAYGHGIVMQGAVNTFIQDCYVEGEMRSTDEILSEKNGIAFDLDYKSNYPPGKIQPNYMIALSEDGIRTYPSGNLVNNRKTEGVTVINTTVKNMRSGFDMSVNLPPTIIIGCTASGCQEKGYSIGTEGVIINSKGDALYGPLLTFQRNDVKNCKINLELIDTTSSYTVNRLAEINGYGHQIKLTNYIDKKRNKETPIVFGESFWSDVHRFRFPATDPKEFSGVCNTKLINETGMPVIFDEFSENNSVFSNGKLIEDNGKNNSYKTLQNRCLQNDVKTIVENKGVRGNNSFDLVSRVDVDVIRNRPDLVIMMVGTNDFLNPQKMISYNGYFQNLQNIVDKLKKANIDVLLMSSIPADSVYLYQRHGKECYLESPTVLMSKASEIVKDIALKNDVLFMDMFNEFTIKNIPYHNEDPFIKNFRNSGRLDGVHPTSKGYQLMANLIYSFMVQNDISTKYKKIICFGDSITFGGGEKAINNYPFFLSNLISSKK